MTVEELGADYHHGCKALRHHEWNTAVGVSELESKNFHSEDFN